MSPVACKLRTTQTAPPTLPQKTMWTVGNHISNIGIYLHKWNCQIRQAAALSCLPAEEAIQKSGIWRHLFLSRCDQSGDLLLCFNSEVKGACGMRMGIVCVCTEGLRSTLPRGGTPWPLADLSPSGVWLWTSAKGDWMCSAWLR